MVADLRKHHQKSILSEGMENSDIQKVYAWFARGWVGRTSGTGVSRAGSRNPLGQIWFKEAEETGP